MPDHLSIYKKKFPYNFNTKEFKIIDKSLGSVKK